MNGRASIGRRDLHALFPHRDSSVYVHTDLAAHTPYVRPPSIRPAWPQLGPPLFDGLIPCLPGRHVDLSMDFIFVVVCAQQSEMRCFGTRPALRMTRPRKDRISTDVGSLLKTAKPITALEKWYEFLRHWFDHSGLEENGCFSIISLVAQDLIQNFLGV